MSTSLDWRWRYSPRPDVRFGFLVVLVFALVGCGARPPDSAPPVRTIDAPQMLISGCRVRTSTSCQRLVLPGSELAKVWLDLVPSAEVSVEFEGQPVAFSSSPAGRGTVLELTLPHRDGRLSVKGAKPVWAASVDLDVQWRAPPLTVFASRQLARGGVPLRALLHVLEAVLIFEEDPRARVDLLNATRFFNVLLRRPVIAQEAERSAAALARKHGFVYDIAELTLIEAFKLERAGRVALTRRALNSIRALSGLPIELVGNIGYQQGLLEAEVGDHAAAARNFEVALRGAERLQSDLLFFSSLQMLAISASELGDDGSAAALIDRGLSALHLLEHDCRNREKTLGNLGWALLRLAEDNVAVDRARLAFNRGLQATTKVCPDHGQASNQRVNLALAALLDWELEEAMFRVDELRGDPPAAGVGEWVEAIDARARYLSGRTQTLPSPLVDPARTPRNPFLAWDAAVLRGERLRAAGLAAAAIEHYDEAEQMLAKASGALGAAAEQESFLARRDDSLEGLLGSLLDSGRPGEAVCRARLAMRRTLLRSDRAARIGAFDEGRRTAWNTAMAQFIEARQSLALEAADDWKYEAGEAVRRRSARVEALARAEMTLTQTQSKLLGPVTPERCKDLPQPPGRHALLVGYFGVEESIVLVETDAGVRWSRGPSPMGDLERWSREVLGPLQLESLDVDVIRLLITGRGHALPWPSLSVGAGQLVDVAALEWGLDLPKQGERERPRTALVVGDPTGDLPEARAEANMAARSLRAARWSVDHLERDDAKTGRVQSLMSSVSLAYFAGHGRRSEAPGGLGWSDALVLADGLLAVPEILGLDQVPSRVIVTGCDSGTTTESGLSGGLNVGRAFLLAGAEQVLVASGKADDAEARVLGNAVARTLSEQPTWSIARALQAAQRQLRAEQPGSRWWQYRVLVR